MNILALIGFVRSPLGKIGMVIFAVLAFGLWVDNKAVQRTLAKVEAERARFELEITAIKSEAEQLGAAQEQKLTQVEKELADVLAAIENTPDDGSGGIAGAASLRLNSIR